MIIDNFFPIPVSFIKIPKSLNNNEINFINSEKIDSYKNIGNTKGSNHYVLDTVELKDLKLILTKYINEYFKTVFEPEKEVELYITNSWLNWTEHGQYHHKHTHTNSLISGVFYIDVVDGDVINFFNPNKLLGNIKIKSPETGKWNCRTWTCPVHKNHLLLFPSELEHEVPERFSSGGTRISLAFNTWFKGWMGDPGYLNGLVLK